MKDSGQVISGFFIGIAALWGLQFAMGSHADHTARFAASTAVNVDPQALAAVEVAAAVAKKTTGDTPSPVPAPERRKCDNDGCVNGKMKSGDGIDSRDCPVCRGDGWIDPDDNSTLADMLAIPVVPEESEVVADSNATFQGAKRGRRCRWG